MAYYLSPFGATSQMVPPPALLKSFSSEIVSSLLSSNRFSLTLYLHQTNELLFRSSIALCNRDTRPSLAKGNSNLVPCMIQLLTFDPFFNSRELSYLAQVLELECEVREVSGCAILGVLQSPQAVHQSVLMGQHIA